MSPMKHDRAGASCPESNQPRRGGLDGAELGVFDGKMGRGFRDSSSYVTIVADMNKCGFRRGALICNLELGHTGGHWAGAVAADYSTPEGQQILWEVSTELLERLTAVAKPLDLPAPEAFAVLMIAIGRFAGGVGYRSFSADELWEHFTASRTFFDLGFKGERAHES
jgi:hypothetical protein